MAIKLLIIGGPAVVPVGGGCDPVVVAVTKIETEADLVESLTLVAVRVAFPTEALAVYSPDESTLPEEAFH